MNYTISTLGGAELLNIEGDEYIYLLDPGVEAILDIELKEFCRQGKRLTRAILEDIVEEMPELALAKHEKHQIATIYILEEEGY
jgi:hypothetical protein